MFYYECQRCSFKINKLSNMKNHLNRKKKCKADFSSFKYTDDELYNLSIVKKYETNNKCNNNLKDETKKFECENCSMRFTTNGNLKRHMGQSCKNVKNENIIINQTINNSNNNSNNITNHINIQLLNPFNSNWSTEHIGLDEKYEIFRTEYIFTKTLEKILENDINLNVLFDEEIAYVFNNNCIEKIDAIKIIRLVIEKIRDTISKFGNEIKKNEIEQNINIINEIINRANIKFNDYKSNKNNFKEDAKIVITDIYNDKRTKTHELLSSILNKSNEVEVLRKGVKIF